MTRTFASLAATALAAAALGQGSFSIVSPLDNARVKEKVAVRLLKNSIPAGGYVGFFLDGKLLEATVPTKRGQFAEWILDTKGRGIPDSPDGRTNKLEAVLYVDYNDQPRIVDRSSVDVRIVNKASIRVPAAGYKLRYGWFPGKELVYNMQQRTVVSSITEAQNDLGGRAAELPVEGETIRLLYAVDNVYGNGDALLRMQPLPKRGKDYADLTVSGEDGAKRYYDYEMAPIYMRVNGVGAQQWGSIPVYVPFEGTSGEASRLDLFGSFPLPSLPTKAVRPGDAWQSRFQDGYLDLEKMNEVTSVVRTRPARGEFVGVEWEMGHPCAKIKNTIAAGEKSLESKKLEKQGAGFQSDVKVSVDETIWFALDTKQVVKIVRDQVTEIKGDVSDVGLGFGSGGGSGGGAGVPAGGAGPSRGGAPGGGGRRGPAGGAGMGVVTDKPSATIKQRGGRGGPPFGPGGMGFPGGGPGGPGGPGGFGRQSGPAVQEQAYLRIRSLRIFTLER